MRPWIQLLIAAVLAASFAASAEARIRNPMLCATSTTPSSGDPAACAAVCQFSKANLRAGWQNGAYTPIPPAGATPPPAITSCKATQSASTANGCSGCTNCTVTICGPAPSSILPSAGILRSPCSGPDDPCGKKPQTVISPGLLEGDSGFVQQGPAAAGVRANPSVNTGATGVVVKSRSY
jgi:hypothetical protein